MTSIEPNGEADVRMPECVGSASGIDLDNFLLVINEFME